MAIHYDASKKLFTLETNQSSYQIKAGRYDYLFHLYYGAKIGSCDLSYLLVGNDRGFSGNPYEAYLENDRTFTLDTLPQEYSTFGSADFRSSCLMAEFADGSQTTELRYVSHKIYPGKYTLKGLPSMWCREDDSTVSTLEITMKDPYSSLEVTLYYGVFEAFDIITRAAKITNHGEDAVRLKRALSACLDFNHDQFDFITFYGKHNMERQTLRRAVCHGKQSIESVRGASSHHHNPFTILCSQDATEDYGDCYGMSFIYSGNFLAETEVDQIDQTRFVMGINPTGFCYKLERGESFLTPEIALSYSQAGLGSLSRNYHKAYRMYLSKSKFTNMRRPVLINNWEATTFDFNDQKLISIAKDAKELGIEMLVMDDGWFGNRDDDLRGLGDWFLNEKKFSKGLTGLVEDVNALGMKFGIWVEPEMVNEDSELFRSHPDWCLHVPGRKGVYSRAQLVLDLSRQEVRDYLFDSIGKILDSANIEYVKWDMNRHLTDVWSASLPCDRQGEVYHRYVLGLYELMDRFINKYPDILFEGCSGGGGRFDAGILYYMPQSWCSDDTDAIERIRIQYGTSFGYPVSSVGSHVSVVPNQQTGRITPLKTRGIVAMAGTFGYELDITHMTEEEKEIAKEQIQEFKRNYDLIQEGDYYRLTNPEEKHDFAAWQFVSQDKAKSLLSLVILHAMANGPTLYVKAKGLAPEKNYKIASLNLTATGAALMNGGFPIPHEKGDYISFNFEIEEA